MYKDLDKFVGTNRNKWDLMQEVHAGLQKVKSYDDPNYKPEPLTLPPDQIEMLKATPFDQPDPGADDEDNHFASALVWERDENGRATGINPWNYLPIMYRCDLIDPFGKRLLLGIFKSREESKAAFDEFMTSFRDEVREMHNVVPEDEETIEHALTMTGENLYEKDLQARLEHYRDTYVNPGT